MQEWTAAGGAAWAAANRKESASGYLHAASYYAAGLALIDQSDGLVEEQRLWERQRECWDRAAQLLGGERLSIVYEHTSLPGYFFSAGPGRGRWWWSITAAGSRPRQRGPRAGLRRQPAGITG